MKHTRILPLIVILLALVACTMGQTSQPTPLPATPIPQEDTPVPPTATNPPEPTTEPTTEPTIEPTEEPTTEPGPLRATEAIHISSFGSSSRLVSPFTVEGNALPTFEQGLGMRLVNLEGVEMAVAYVTIQSPAGSSGPFTAVLPFTITQAEESARLMVFSTSPKDGGLTHVTSLMITLLAGGSPQLTEPATDFETIEIMAPAPGQQVYNRTVPFYGYSEYFFEANLGVALCGEGGSGVYDPICGTADNLLAQSSVMIDSPDMGIPGPFEGSIEYQVGVPTNARLVIYALSPADGGIEHLSSVEIVLNP